MLFLFKSYDYMSNPIPTTKKIKGKKKRGKGGVSDFTKDKLTTFDPDER